MIREGGGERSASRGQSALTICQVTLSLFSANNHTTPHHTTSRVKPTTDNEKAGGENCHTKETEPADRFVSRHASHCNLCWLCC
mmetsp:Transcript_6699/g.16232  ORF Transcript_6699/g.16232 Transcript_6699/m.16232 type:complete len:84 (-) Transcript_6699:147-398(-)